MEKREWLENIFVFKASYDNQGLLMLKSFVKIQKHKIRPVDDIMLALEGKNVYIIAAGPSLDKNVEQLRNVDSKSVVITTGTVLSKLLNMGIVPDYAVIIDANMETLKQIEGIENCGVPLIILSTANYKVIEKYSGKKYVAYQKGYERAEKFAKENGLHIFNTGGSVTTLCIDMAIQARCRRLICVGMDLALTGGKTHADNTPRHMEHLDTTGKRMVMGQNGEMIPTHNNLDMYRKWIENRIANVKDIEFINATEGGALVKGMKNMTLRECIEMYDS